MTEKKSNFARMDELEVNENIQFKGDTGERPMRYDGTIGRLLWKMKLTPMLAIGIVLFALSYVIPFFIIFRALSIVLLLVGLVERLFIKAEDDE